MVFQKIKIDLESQTLTHSHTRTHTNILTTIHAQGLVLADVLEELESERVELPHPTPVASEVDEGAQELANMAAVLTAAASFGVGNAYTAEVWSVVLCV